MPPRQPSPAPGCRHPQRFLWPQICLFLGLWIPQPGGALGFCEARGRSRAGLSAGELREQQKSRCLPWEGGCISFFSPSHRLPFKAAPNERLSRAASVTKTRLARRKKQLRGGKQIRCRGPEVLPPPAAHPGPPPPSLRRGSTRGFGTSKLGVMEDAGKSRIPRERLVGQSRAGPRPSGVGMGMVPVPCLHPGGAFLMRG